MGIPQNRYYCSNHMFGAYYAMSAIDEKELATWIMNTGSELDHDPLDSAHPRRQEEIEEYKGMIKEIIAHLSSYLPPEERNITHHPKVVSQLITVLEQAEHDDVSLPSNRQRYVSSVYNAYKEIPFEEQELVEWLLSQSDTLEAAPLAKDDPAHADEIEQYRGKIRRMVKYLKSTLPDSPKPEEYRNTLNPS